MKRKMTRKTSEVGRMKDEKKDEKKVEKKDFIVYIYIYFSMFDLIRLLVVSKN
jgi:hypothetical protein